MLLTYCCHSRPVYLYRKPIQTVDMKITSYLIFNGQAEEAAGFYADALGGKIENLYRYESMPPHPDMPVPADFKEKILHCCITFPGGSMSAADTLPNDPRNFGNGGHMLTLDCDAVAQAEAVYAKLSNGAQKIPCAIAEAYFAKRYAEIVERYGVQWAIMYEEA